MKQFMHGMMEEDVRLAGIRNSEDTKVVIPQS